MSAQPIELHYWPTPNGWKVSIALEEMGLSLHDDPGQHRGGRAVSSLSFLSISPNNRMPAIVDPNGPGGEGRFGI